MSYNYFSKLFIEFVKVKNSKILKVKYIYFFLKINYLFLFLSLQAGKYYLL